MNLYSMRIYGKWYKTKSFRSINKTNEFLADNQDFGLLTERKSFDGNPVYIVARLSDLGSDLLTVTFESEDVGFCQRYYRADCGRLFAMVDGQLHTCNDDAWREPCTSVKHEFFNILEKDT